MLTPDNIGEKFDTFVMYLCHALYGPCFCKCLSPQKNLMLTPIIANTSMSFLGKSAPLKLNIRSNYISLYFHFQPTLQYSSSILHFIMIVIVYNNLAMLPVGVY